MAQVMLGNGQIAEIPDSQLSDWLSGLNAGGGGWSSPGVGPAQGGGGGFSDLSAGSMLSGTGTGGSTAWYNTPWGEALIKGGLGLITGKLLGGQTGAEKGLQQFSTAGFGSPQIQRFLPASLQAPFAEPMLAAGLGRIGSLLQNPGGLSPNVAEAIGPRLASESQSIGQNFRNLQSQTAGAAARSNLPVSIKGALQAALGVGQERAQREARQSALSESGQLQREDLGNVWKLLDALLQFTSSGRGQAIQGLGSAAGNAVNRQASQMALIGSLLGSVA